MVSDDGGGGGAWRADPRVDPGECALLAASCATGSRMWMPGWFHWVWLAWMLELECICMQNQCDSSQTYEQTI